MYITPFKKEHVRLPYSAALSRMVLMKIKFPKGDIQWVCLLLIFQALPLVIKILITGRIGPKAEFYYLSVWMPSVAILMGSLRSFNTMLTFILLFSLALGLVFVQWTTHPMMDFQRQFTQQALPLFFMALALGLLIASRMPMTYLMSRLRRRSNS
jgi:hypothetical protein